MKVYLRARRESAKSPSPEAAAASGDGSVIKCLGGEKKGERIKIVKLYQMFF